MNLNDYEFYFCFLFLSSISQQIFVEKLTHGRKKWNKQQNSFFNMTAILLCQRIFFISENYIKNALS